MVAKRRRTRQPSANRSSSPNRPPPSGRADNLLLAALPQADRARLDRALDVIPLKLKDLLHKPGERIQHVYFPAGGFCSVLTVLEDGSMVEVATIGREGIGRRRGDARRRSRSVGHYGASGSGHLLSDDR
jgi:hypothetical protein